ncbi:hypothetical protein AOQ84DRAFT_397660 [Glonium stellatum]|uniref:Uncharacterized protein n=1 Tax=Glonium stellatum TaxID=574774 RepID=A0A8E2F1L4_9PEZI|nr:hypothetical protein AOQ84DRAFT_397660 [Glonium stellatum]
MNTPHDFRVDFQHVNSPSADSLQYWESVVDLCDESVRTYPANESGRDVFALESVIVKSSRPHKIKDGQHTEIDYLHANANEVQAIAIVTSVLTDVRLNDHQVLVQETLKHSNMLTNGRIHALEGNILVSDTSIGPHMSLMHSDSIKFNCIVESDKIVGLKTTGEIHRRIRTPQREHFANANLSEETL